LSQHEQATSKSAIREFIEDTSNKHKVRLILPFLEPSWKEVFENCKKVFDLRNEILHAPKMKVSENESEKAISAVESFLTLASKS
jgi:hypothetical protein